MWTLTLPTLTNADFLHHRAAFVGSSGSYHLFSFRDPDTGRVYSRVRYASHTFAVKHVAFHLNEVALKLIEVYGPGLDR